ncbi:MAG TPA: hypothetical protein VGV92_08455 [Gammaproteobacteria bacterium]|nr:hypothetical protein [Gammaproteobacteria bacterium]
MEERGNNRIDEAYFNTICEKLPFLRELRADQESMGNNYFVLLIHFFQKFSKLESDLRLERNPQKRYELLFNIIEMGNLIDTMRLVEQCQDMEKQTSGRQQLAIKNCIHALLTLKRYRNVVADGYHAYSTKTGADIISSFQFFFKELGARRPTQPFYRTSIAFKDSMYDAKDKFKFVNTPEDIYLFIYSEGDKEAKKLKITALLEGIKYFLDKAAALYKQDKKDCASLYFIAGANCARDLEDYYNQLHPRDRRASHIADLLSSLTTLRQDRGQQFAHKVGDQKKVSAAAMKKKLSNEDDPSGYMLGIYKTIDTYLQREYGIEPTMAKEVGSIKITYDSPRPYVRTPVIRRDEYAPRMLFFPEEPQPQIAKKSQAEKKRDRGESDRRKDLPAERDKSTKQHRQDRSPTRK